MDTQTRFLAPVTLTLTLIYELDLIILKTYLHNRNELVKALES